MAIGPNKTSAGSATSTPDQILIHEAEKIVTALGRMLAPFCEVVLHDLRDPARSIIAIETPISGRKVGDATTEMGLARIADPDFPDVVQNYANRFPDGRPAKSTSIGIRDGQGRYIAALCLNMDLSLFSSMQHVLSEVTSVSDNANPISETLRSRSLDEIRTMVDRYAAARNVSARSLDTGSRRELIGQLAREGVLQMKGAAGAVAAHLGVSRGSLYNDLKKAEG